MSTYNYHRRTVAELYFNDPFVSNADYAALMQEADEMDLADEHNAAVLAAWEERAEEEEGEPS